MALSMSSSIAAPPAAGHSRTSIAPLLSLRGVTKRFTGVLALDGVDFDVRAGELHVLFGENGAGKSTLINVIAGTFSPDEGEFHYRGEEIRQLTPHRARAIGISPVFQEFSLVPSLTVEDNLFLGREMSAGGVLRAGRMRRAARKLIAELGFGLDPNKRVDDLSRAHQQMTEIAKALLGDVKLLILDEPTASLTERETGRLFELIAKLKSEGVGIIYVSHRMREIRALADRITVLRDGRLVKTLDAEGVADGELVELMTGRKIDVLFPKITHSPGDVAVDAENLAIEGGSVAGVNFYAAHRRNHRHRRSRWLREVRTRARDLRPRMDCRRNGSPFRRALRAAEPRREPAAQAGVFSRQPRRGRTGAVAPHPRKRSMSALDLGSFAKFGVLNIAGERAAIQPIMDQLRLRPPDIERAVGNLSGGNRQKVMLGRALTRELSIFLFDEPTVGIDVGAKLEVYEFMKQLVEAGAAVVVVSSELQEVLALSNRLYVMHHGKMVAELQGEDKTEGNVLASFFSDEAAPVAAQ